jgi:hypothetical protein
MFLSTEEASVKTLTVLAGTGFMILGSLGSAQAQVSGTPNSPFPYAAPHEVQIINGMPCRTVLDHGSNLRIPIQCAGPSGIVGMAPGMEPGMDPMTTGSILPAPGPGAAVSGTPGSLFPNAAPHEIRFINGVPCRTVLVPGTSSRVPVECAR